jgi:uncharacterized membrane protein
MVPKASTDGAPPEGKGPACRALQAYLRSHRPRLPPVLRTSMALSILSAGGILILLAAAFLASVPMGVVLAQTVVIATISGPQAATLFAFAQDFTAPPWDLVWVLTYTQLNMMATFFLIVPLAWRGFERLRDVRFLGGLVRSAERYSVKHRKFLAKWGLLGLVLVTFAPVQGGGVLGAGVLGVLLRIPVNRLLWTVAAAGTVLNVAWTVVLYAGASAMPAGGIWDWIPYLVIGAMVAAGIAAGIRGHQRRFRFEVETIPGTPAAQQAKLNSVGIVEEDYVLRADLRQVCDHLGIPRDDLVRARNTAEVLRLDNMPPPWGERLTAAGLASIREVALAPPELVRAALEEVKRPGQAVPDLAEVESWRQEAQRFEREFHKQVHAHNPSGVPVA